MSNREGFRSFTCRFKVNEGKASTLDDALAGRLEPAITQTGLWIVNGDKVRYELTCDAPLKVPMPSSDAEPTSTGGRSLAVTRVDCASYAILADAQLKLRHSLLLKGCNVGKLTPQGPGIPLTPISMGVMGGDERRNPAEEIRQGLQGEGFCRFEGIEEVDDSRLYVVATGRTVQDGEGQGIKTTKWHLDPDRGFLPIRVVSLKGPHLVRYRVFATHIRRCSNGHYLPERSVYVRFPEEDPPFAVRIVELLELDVDHPPDDADFALHIPAGTPILDPKDNRAFYKLDRAERIALDDLPEVIDRCSRALEGRLAGLARSANEALPAPQRGWRGLIVVGNLAILLLVVVVFLLLRRRYRRRRGK